MSPGPLFRFPTSPVWLGRLTVGLLAPAWKPGFTRADGRVLGFFSFAVLLALRPLTESTDRDLQELELSLPVNFSGFGLIANSGPNQQGVWDWTYWQCVEFAP